MLSAGAAGTGGSSNTAGSVIIQSQQNGAESLVVKDTSNANIFAVSTTSNSIILGNPGTRDGNIIFQNSGNTNTVEFSTGLTTASYSIFLPTSAGTLGQCLYISNKPSSVDEQLGHTDCLTTATGIQLQASTPGTAQTGNINISGTGVFGAAVSTVKLTVTGHIVSGGSTPSIAAGAGAGTGPTVSVAGTDIAGVITVTTGTGPATGKLAGITFASAFTAAPNVVLTPANANAAGLQAYVDSATTSTTVFDLDAATTAPTASTTYKWYYHVIQ